MHGRMLNLYGVYTYGKQLIQHKEGGSVYYMYDIGTEYFTIRNLKGDMTGFPPV